MALRGAALAVFAAIALAPVACQTAKPRMLEFERGEAQGLRVVVAPMNLAVPLSPDLEDAVEPVTDELLRYLRSLGTRVAVIWTPDASVLWRDAALAVQKDSEEPPEFGKVAGVFARLLSREAEFDLLLLPSLLFREAEVKGRFAQWDGVRRRIRVRATAVAPVGRAQSSADPLNSTERSVAGPVTPEWSGHITGLSLHALLFTPEGHAVFQGLGGLDLVHDAVRSTDGLKSDAFLQLQGRILEDPEHVREGISLALEPYLSESPAR